MRRQKLSLEALAVDSFETSAGTGERGTVRGRESDDEPIEFGGCTCDESCLCPTAAYYCATVQETVISCDYTFNGSCHRTNVTCGSFSCNICTD